MFKLKYRVPHGSQCVMSRLIHTGLGSSSLIAHVLHSLKRRDGVLRLSLDPRIYFPWDGISVLSHPTCDVPFPKRRPSEYWKGMIPARPCCTRGAGDRFGIPKPQESGSVIGADRRRSAPSRVLPKGVPQGQTESRGAVLAAICWAPSAQRRCHPKEALYLSLIHI